MLPASLYSSSALWFARQVALTDMNETPVGTGVRPVRAVPTTLTGGTTLPGRFRTPSYDPPDQGFYADGSGCIDPDTGARVGGRITAGSARGLDLAEGRRKAGPRPEGASEGVPPGTPENERRCGRGRCRSRWLLWGWWRCYILHLRESTPRNGANHRERRLAGDFR
jgi:hypothetical protein